MPILNPPWSKDNEAAQIALAAYGQVLAQVRGDRLVRERLSGSPPETRWHLLATGKASVGMARGAMEAWGAPASGLVITKAGHGEDLGPQVEVLESDHPVPSDRSLAAGAAVERFASVCAGDPVLVLLSGGSSALVESLHPGVTLAELIQETDRLLRAGATIEVLNAARSRLSRLKAGGMASLFACSELRALVLSDVVGDDLRVIASGPLVTPERSIPHEILGNAALVARLTVSELRARGIQAVEGPALVGECGDLGRLYARLSSTLPPRSAMVGTGEGVVMVRGPGLGGRCQEMATAAAPLLPRGVALLAGSTDGTDGPTDVGAALVDSEAPARAAPLTAAECLARSDSHAFLKAAQGLIRTGPTQSNLNDALIAVRC